MSNLVKNLLEAKANLALCEANLRAAVAAKIKNDFQGYELPKDANIKIDESGKIEVNWRDYKALSYGFFHDGEFGIHCSLDPEDLWFPSDYRTLQEVCKVFFYLINFNNSSFAVSSWLSVQSSLYFS